MIIKPSYVEKTSIASDLIVSVSDLGAWLNLSTSAVSVNSEMLSELIKTATEIIEGYTWLTLRETTYEAYYEIEEVDKFFNGDLGLSLERSPVLDLDNITKIEYLNASGTWTEFSRGTKTIDGLYTNTTEIKQAGSYASVYFITDVPFDSRDYAYKIKITFTAGWDIDATNEALKMPYALKVAIKKIAAFHYVNRGDCQSECSINGYPVPCDVKVLLDRYALSIGFTGAL